MSFRVHWARKHITHVIDMVNILDSNTYVSAVSHVRNVFRGGAKNLACLIGLICQTQAVLPSQICKQTMHGQNLYSHTFFLDLYVERAGGLLKRVKRQHIVSVEVEK